MKNFEVLWQGYHKGFPHYPEFCKHNTDVKSHFIVSSLTNKREAWRNPDAELMKWWRVNKNNIIADYIYVFEWDVYINVRLKEHQCNVGVKSLITQEPWDWFREVDKLKSDKQYAAGVVPYAALYLHRSILDRLCEDPLYNDDIFCELRTGTLLNKYYDITILNEFKKCGYVPRRVDGRGIFHSVKDNII